MHRNSVVLKKSYDYHLTEHKVELGLMGKQISKMGSPVYSRMSDEDKQQNIIGIK